MDEPYASLDRARATESALAHLRAELDALERNSGPMLLGPGGPAAQLGTSVDDLARMHEEHAATMRRFGRVLREDDEPAPRPPYYTSSVAAAPPLYSEEPDLGLVGHRIGSAASAARSVVGGSAPAMPPRPNFSRPLLNEPPAMPSASAVYSTAPGTATAGGSHSARLPSTSASIDESMPMHRPGGARREMAQAAASRAEAVAASRYAREAQARREAAEEAAQRTLEAQARAAQRSGYVAERLADDETRPQGEFRGHGGSSSARASNSARGGASGALPPGPQQRLASLATSASASLPVRMPVRPASAPKERPRITVPTPFSFEHRPKHDAAALRKMRNELAEERKALEEARKENKARPVPATNEPGLYMKQMQMLEEKSRERRQVRRTVPQPFSFQSRSERKASPTEGHADDAYGEMLFKAAEAEDVGTRKPYRAREVPRSMSEPRWEMMRIRESERREKCAQDALRLLAKSKLPPRMQLHKETERARKAAEAERIQAELDKELTLTPRITDEPPEGYDAYFKRKHLEDERRQARKRSSYQPTVPAPFRMDMAPIKERRDEKRKMKRYMEQQDMRRDALMMPEQRWPYLATQAPVGRSSPPDFPALHQKAALFSETTKLFIARKEKLEQELAESKKKEEAKKKEEEMRQQQQKAATAEVAKRLEEITGSSRDRKKQFAEKEAEMKRQIRENNLEQKRTAKKWLDDINARVAERRAKRGFMFEQAQANVAAERAKAEALDRFDETLRKKGIADMLDTH